MKVKKILTEVSIQQDIRLFKTLARLSQFLVENQQQLEIIREDEKLMRNIETVVTTINDYLEN